MRGLIRLNGHDEAAAAERLREIHRKLTPKHPLAIGLSNRCQGAARVFAPGSARPSTRWWPRRWCSSEPGVVAFDDLGAYKYLLKVSQDGRVRDRRGEALQQLAALRPRAIARSCC